MRTGEKEARIGSYPKSVAMKAAADHAAINASDSHAFNRALSRIANGIYTPDEVRNARDI
jgi:hypothetical protein